VDGERSSRARVDADRFTQYADHDLDRWRQLIGGEAVHADSRWGTGTVEDVRWGSSGANAPTTILIRVRSPQHGRVTFTDASFASHHRQVSVPVAIRAVIRGCFEGDLPDAEREAILEQHSRDLREAHDRRMLERAKRLRERRAKC